MSRYVRLDVDFFFKRTCRALLEQFGHQGPLIFIALIARAKDGDVPGTFSYPSDSVCWDKLGLGEAGLTVTPEEFFAFTGRIKQTRKTCRGRATDVKLTRYEDWQKESGRYEARVRKSRSRAQNTRDMSVTAAGHESDTSRDLLLLLETPNPFSFEDKKPRAKGTNPRAKGTNQRAAGANPRATGTNPRAGNGAHPEPRCPRCGVTMLPGVTVAEHLWNVHDIRAET